MVVGDQLQDSAYVICMTVTEGDQCEGSTNANGMFLFVLDP